MQHRIALVGRSLGLNIIGATLEGRREFELFRFDGTLVDGAAWIDGVAPKIVIFDMTGASSTSVFGSIRSLGLILIGCDMATQEMVVVSGEQVRLSGVEDLLRVFSQHDLCEDENGEHPA